MILDITTPKSTDPNVVPLPGQYFVEFHDAFFYTVTLPPEYYRFKIKEQYRIMIDEIKDKLFPKCYIYNVCELTKAGNIHAHGIMVFKNKKAYKNPENKARDMFRYKKSDNNHVFGFSQVNRIRSCINVKKYITKDIEKTTEELNTSPICTNFTSDLFKEYVDLPMVIKDTVEKCIEIKFFDDSRPGPKSILSYFHKK